MPPERVQQLVSARIPTAYGEARLVHYSYSGDDKEHLAMVTGDVRGGSDVLVRVHSECFTGEVLGSVRCDCAGQLDAAIQAIAREGAGILIYLRQEGRGIGLTDKLRAYNLQDAGYDTLDANLRLGHAADERDYTVAALILADLGVGSVRLMTNNPAKVDAIRSLGVRLSSRVPVSADVTTENVDYLTTKIERMGHLLTLDGARIEAVAPFAPTSDDRSDADTARRPLVTLTYAQSLDGSIAAPDSVPLSLSGSESAEMTHLLRSANDAILVGIGTVIADNPSLTVRLTDGRDPRPIVLDSNLRFPVDAELLQKSHRLAPWIVTTEQAPRERQVALERVGARVIRMPANEPNGTVDLNALMDCLFTEGIHDLMVEGGARVITAFLANRLVDHVVITIAPMLVGGLHAVTRDSTTDAPHFPRLSQPGYRKVGADLVVWGRPDWSTE